MKKWALFIPAWFLAVGVCAERSWQRFYPDDPVWREPEITVKKPAAARRSRIADFFDNNSAWKPHGEIVASANANTLGEVPDSSWFQNRIGTGKMSAEDVVRGPNRSDGPDMSAPWEITDPKTEGVTAGFKIKDARGDTYFVKLDPLRYPQLTTSAEVISTKFFYAFGFNTPANYLAFVRRDQMRVGEKAIRQGFTEKLFDRLLEKAPRRPDGTWQVIASLKIQGDPVSGFKWHGTRPDDPNDVIPHENRRELRGGRLFCAWLNHTDVNTKNTLDVFVGKKDSGYVKHYLIDFGTTLGSGAYEPHRARLGSEYAVDWADTAKSMITLGLWEREWQKIEFPDYPTIGNFEARHFHPELWKPDQLNPAFLRMRLGDAFWAASILSQFSDRVVSRVVKEGRLSDAQAEAYLIRTLLDRRDKILSYYLSLMNPIDRFQVQQSAARSELHFANIGAETGVGQADSYEYTWYSYDNSSDRLKRLDGPRRVGLESIPIPRITDHAFLAVQFRTFSRERPDWAKPVVVYLRREGSGYRVIGIEREEQNTQQDLERRRQLAERQNGATAGTE